MRINIKDIMDKKDMSRYELAKRIGVTYPTISSIYYGESTSIKLKILEAMCKELECSPNDILLMDEEPNPTKSKTFNEILKEEKGDTE